MAEFNNFLTALAGFAWPAALLVILVYFRRELRSIALQFQRQLASGAALKWKDFEFRAIQIDALDLRNGSEYTQVPADKFLFDKRHKSYRDNKNLFLVHRTRPSGQFHPFNKLPTYDITVYLLSHKNFGHLNDVREVQYYFGQHFGLKQNEYGTKFVVTNGTDNFAVRTNAYGPTLCEARIVFHDGSETSVSRYLDFEGAGYRFSVATNESDAEKIKSRVEDVSA
ncbi:pYEATS domain-containing protein [Bradyrhizobium sp. 62B]|uniref:pYEATS domain-containing protein n=1 Tax=Bradyrhizobium sp. 62B TaxID=2898442 RepID=UPI002557C9BC|nr:pYEATS domain-containing protein [Bradyrhizobium sp. 62B]